MPVMVLRSPVRVTCLDILGCDVRLQEEMPPVDSCVEYTYGRRGIGSSHHTARELLRPGHLLPIRQVHEVRCGPLGEANLGDTHVLGGKGLQPFRLASDEEDDAVDEIEFPDGHREFELPGSRSEGLSLKHVLD